MFQDAAGTTPVTAAEQPVGLILDKSKGLVLGAELVTNGDFSNGTTGWSQLFATISSVAGAMRVTSTGTGSAGRGWRVFPTVAGRTYKITADLVGGTTGISIGLGLSGTASIDIGGAVIGAGLSSPGSIIFVATGTSSSVAGLLQTTTLDVYATIDNISVRELPGNHATQTTATKRPILKLIDGKYSLLFDGIDDALVTGSIDFTATDKMTVVAGVRKLSDSAPGVVTELSSTYNTNNGAFFIDAPDTAGTYAVVLKGTLVVSYIPPGYTAPISNVLSVQYDIAGTARSTAVIPRINGILAPNNGAGTTAGAGNFGNYPLFIGSRGGTSLPFNGHLYSLIVRGAQSTDAQITSAETWVNSKTGAY